MRHSPLVSVSEDRNADEDRNRAPARKVRRARSTIASNSPIIQTAMRHGLFRRKISTRRRPHETQFAGLDARNHDFRLIPPSALPSPSRVPIGHSRVDCAPVRIQATIRAIAFPSCRNGTQKKRAWPVVFRTGLSQGTLLGLLLLRSSTPSIGCPDQQIPAIPTCPTKPTPATSLVKALSRRPVIVERPNAVSRFDRPERPRLVSILGTTILLKASSRTDLALGTGSFNIDI